MDKITLVQISGIKIEEAISFLKEEASVAFLAREAKEHDEFVVLQKDNEPYDSAQYLTIELPAGVVARFRFGFQRGSLWSQLQIFAPDWGEIDTHLVRRATALPIMAGCESVTVDVNGRGYARHELTI